jgi:solute:Na+ symporter, SSS family
MNAVSVNFAPLDWAVVGLYFVILAGIALWVAFQREKTSADYFLANRSAGWFLIGASIFASNIGAEHLVGLAGSGAKSGMAYAHWELHSYLCIVLGWLFAPFYLRSGVFTTPEFLEKRYTPATRTVLSLIFLISYILTKASVTIYAGAITIKTILGIDHVMLPGLGEVDFFWVSAFALVAITGLYTIVGGMKAVLWTEGVQAPLLLIGSVIILIVGLDRIGGLDALRAANEGAISMWRPLSTTPETQGFPGFLFEPTDTPWLGVMLASPVLGLWYWCTDQYIVQRILAARNLKQARQGAIFAGYLKLFPVFIFLIPGMIAVALQKQGAPGFAEMTSPDQAFPLLASYLLPDGLRGLVLAGMLAALMSSLASLFNSTATLFTVDFYKRVRPQSSERHLVDVGRIATIAVVGLGIAWIPVLLQISGGGLYAALQAVQALLAPAIAAVFLMGIASKFVSPISGLVGLSAGFVIGMARLFLQTAADPEAPYPGPVQTFVDINWLYFAFLLFAFSCAVIVLVSLVTPKATPEQIQGLTLDTVTDAQRAEVRASYGGWEIFHTCMILAIIAGVYIYFW